MKTNNNIPACRFRGYTDAWELRKLGETVIEIIAGGDIDKNKVVNNGKYPIYANSQNGDGIVGYYDDYYRVKGPAVTVTGRGEVGFAKARETDFTPVVRLLAIRSNHNHYFLEHAINLHRVIVESTGVPQLTAPQLSSYRIFFPRDIQEENQIGTFFSTLDQQITHHQRKLDTLKEQKKTYLKLLFPAKGQTKPALRFQGFEDDWEEVKFGDLWNHTSEKNSELNYSSKDIISVAKMQQGKISKDSTDEYMKTYNILKYGDIAFEGNKSKEFSFGRFVYNDFKTGIVSHVFITFSPKVNMSSKFMKIFINNENIMKYELAKATTKTLMMTTLNVADMNKRRLRLPSLPEQEAIGTFFQILDQEIAQVEDKLASLKEMKKTLLRKLFV
ncbi:TPA: restriction endonuclease subunit S [Streptococcus suis]|nr:restriction endonuclease subunit S [Streptococcus suis]